MDTVQSGPDRHRNLGAVRGVRPTAATTLTDAAPSSPRRVRWRSRAPEAAPIQCFSYLEQQHKYILATTPFLLPGQPSAADTSSAHSFQSKTAARVHIRRP